MLFYSRACLCQDKMLGAAPDIMRSGGRKPNTDDVSEVKQKGLGPYWHTQALVQNFPIGQED